MALTTEFMVEQLRALYSHGHPDFIPKLVDLMELHSTKNYGYAHGGDPLGNFERRQKILALYPGLSAKAETNPAIIPLLDMLKQLDALLWQICQGYQDDVEDSDQRAGDSIVYLNIHRILWGDNSGF